MDIDGHEITNLTSLFPISKSPDFKICNFEYVLSTLKLVYYVLDPKMSTAQYEPDNVGLDTLVGPGRAGLDLTRSRF